MYRHRNRFAYSLVATAMALLLTLTLTVRMWATTPHTPAGTPSSEGQPYAPSTKIEVQRLPNLNTPRGGHMTFRVGDEVVVAGGHTSGFVPTRTAEYFSDGEWHQIEMVYDHDQGFALVLKSGEVLLAGGYEKALGIGQTFPVERYIAAEHRFEGFSCLDQKRCAAEGVELDSGRVVVSGNWYADDTFEIYEAGKGFSPLKKASQARSCPLMFRTDSDDLIAFSGMGNTGTVLDTIIIDRLKGPAFTDPIFQTWRPCGVLLEHHSSDCFIGDEATGDYSYLLPVGRADGETGVMLVRSRGGKTQFSIVRTSRRLPRVGYFTNIIVDRQRQRGYIVGHDPEKRLVVVCLDYAPLLRQPTATLPTTIGYTDPIEDSGNTTPILTREGNLLLAGGIGPTHYVLYDAAFVLLVGQTPHPATSRWLWVGAALLVALAAAGGWLLWARRRKGRPAEGGSGQADEPHEAAQPADGPAITQNERMAQITMLMEKEQLFLRNDLKVSDLAGPLGIASRTISDCIKGEKDCTFSQFVNSYRIAHAQQLLRQNPDMKILTVSTDSGFANEQTFFRTFKTFTGMTPKEWIQANTEGPTDR